MESLLEFVERTVNPRGPLYAGLQHLILATGEMRSRSPVFRLTELDHSRSTYLCTEMGAGTQFVCKFFGGRYELSSLDRRNLLNHEFNCLTRIRDKGLDRSPHSVVRPLAKFEELSCLLTEDYVEGKDLDYYISRAAYHQERQRLIIKLSMLAEFFGKLHSRTTVPVEPNFSRVAVSFRGLLSELLADDLIDQSTMSRLSNSCFKWEATRRMWPATSCLVHGDATPTNFIFNPKEGVTAIDLERMHTGDPMLDIGMLAAELKHHFALRIHNANSAEQFISHLLKSYSCKNPALENAFQILTFRSRFYMAFGELRIARNLWLPLGHRRWLVNEAIQCLNLTEGRSEE